MLELASVELMRTEQLGPMGVPRTGMAAMFQGIGLGVNTTIDPEQPNYYRGAARGAGDCKAPRVWLQLKSGGLQVAGWCRSNFFLRRPAARNLLGASIAASELCINDFIV